MEIQDIIDRHLIITNLKCQTKNEAFQKMSHILLKILLGICMLGKQKVKQE